MKACSIQPACWSMGGPHGTLRTRVVVFHPRRGQSPHVPVGVRGWASFVASNSTNMYRREKDVLEMRVKVLQKDV